MGHEDRRVIRTKKLIRDKFAELIEDKGLDKITIKDLTEKADINRGTFYLHFQDKYDLLEQSENELIENIKIIAMELHTINVEEWDQTNAPPTSALRYFAFLKEHAVFLKAILGPKGNPGFQNKLKQLMAEQIKAMFAQKNQEQTAVPSDYFVIVCCCL
ncbi:TetR/AcrR family transcriptional regulator [Alkalibacillus aidingensis]|uniref:TetR/AcrR family transcriptional regulator n=1 Tax=Alkalibacillus aidingensis TaxID=2747607 RepID=UPI0016609315|nr:TetR family transcriptional regulator [Alkalibacillus aidingensis]